MSTGSRTKVTAEEFFALPEKNTPVELINGEIIVSPSPIPEHQDIVLTLGSIFRQIAKQQNGRAFIAPLDVYLDEVNIPQPDVMYLVPNSKCVVGDKRLIGAPDLIVEVLSPGSVREDKREKFRLYERFGVREYWIADPREKLIEVWQWIDGHYLLLDVYGVGESFTSAIVGTINVESIFS